MQRCKISFSLPGRMEIHVDPGEEETLEELLEQLSEGCAPTWLEELVKSSIILEGIEIEEIKTVGKEPSPGEPLDFDL